MSAKPIRINGHTVSLSVGGFLGLVHYECRRDSDRELVTSGAISRLNFPGGGIGDKAHRAAIRAACTRAIEEAAIRAALALAEKPE